MRALTLVLLSALACSSGPDVPDNAEAVCERFGNPLLSKSFPKPETTTYEIECEGNACRTKGE